MEQIYTCPGCGRATHAGPMKRHMERCLYPFTIARLFALAGVEMGTNEECWLATKGLNGLGYPRVINPRTGLRTRASRLVLEILSGEPVASDMNVLHSCDTPPCLNPFHLRAGTQAENMKDMWDKGRGELHLENLGRWK